MIINNNKDICGTLTRNDTARKENSVAIVSDTKKDGDKTEDNYQGLLDENTKTELRVSENLKSFLWVFKKIAFRKEVNIFQLY